MEITDIVDSFDGMAKGLDTSFSYFWPPTGNQDPVELNMTVNFSYKLRDKYDHRDSHFYFEVAIPASRKKHDGVFMVDNSILVIESKRLDGENLEAISKDLKRLKEHKELLKNIAFSGHWDEANPKMLKAMPFYSVMLFQTYTKNEEIHNLVKMWKEGPPNEKPTQRDHQMNVRKKIIECWGEGLKFAAYRCEKLEKAWQKEGSDNWVLYFLLAVKKHK